MGPEAVSKAHILVVDDKPTNLVTLSALLEGDHHVLVADSGRKAIELIEAGTRVDVILMDVQMPGMDGFEAAAAIKKTEAGREIPIIFVTAVYHEDPFVRKGYESGGIDYFSKPFDPSILKMKVGIYAAFRQRHQHLLERERHVRESEELLRVGRKLASVLESLPVGVMIADVEGRICQTTEEVSRILRANVPAEADAYGEILGWWDRGGQAIKREGSPLARALLGAASHSEPLQIRCLDGTPKTIVASASPLRGVDGRLVGAVVLVQDVTESRKIEEALQQRVAGLIGLGVELEESAVR